MVPLSQLKNFKPRKCKKLLLDNDWISINRKGTHETFMKKINGKIHMTQLIWNDKNCHPKNVKNMIEKTDIPVEEWIKNCK
jgi:predicted RNA binding protein YcfA (HicA-like mRNA interferase family)